jgi:hypothetical protein
MAASCARFLGINSAFQALEYGPKLLMRSRLLISNLK